MHAPGRGRSLMPESLPEFDLYAELGVARGASPGEVEAAWRERIQAAHPDRSGVGSERDATVIAFSLAALVLAFFALLGLLTLLAGRRRR